MQCYSSHSSLLISLYIAYIGKHTKPTRKWTYSRPSETPYIARRVTEIHRRKGPVPSSLLSPPSIGVLCHCRSACAIHHFNGDPTMRFFTASCDSSWDGPTPEPAKCPFTNPYGVFYTGKSERDEVEARDDGYMLFTRRSESEGSGQRRVEADTENQEVDGTGMGGLGRGMVVAMQDGMRDSRQSVPQGTLRGHLMM
jgi:hypothetical protein